MKPIRLAAPLALAALAALAPAGPAQAREWLPIEGHSELVLATCSDGSQVLSGLADDPQRNRYSMQPILDDEGQMTGVLLMLRYAGDFVHSTTGRTLSGSGTDRIVMDFVDGTETHTGNRWTVAIKGEGWVVKEAGQVTLTLADGVVLGYSGLNETGWERLCPFFGVPA